MSWIIMVLSVLAAILVLALLISVDSSRPQTVRLSRQPKSEGTNGQAGNPAHSSRQQRIRQTFSMF